MTGDRKADIRRVVIDGEVYVSLVDVVDCLEVLDPRAPWWAKGAVRDVLDALATQFKALAYRPDRR